MSKTETAAALYVLAGASAIADLCAQDQADVLALVARIRSEAPKAQTYAAMPIRQGNSPRTLKVVGWEVWSAHGTQAGPFATEEEAQAHADVLNAA